MRKNVERAQRKGAKTQRISKGMESSKEGNEIPFLGDSATSGMTSKKYHTSTRRTRLHISERVLSQDSFRITELPKGTELFEVRGDVLSREGRKELYDMYDHCLMTMTADQTQALYPMAVLDRRDASCSDDMMVVRKRGLLPGKGRSCLEVLREGVVVMEMHSNSGRTEAIVRDVSEETPLMKMTRGKMSLRKVAAGVDSYEAVIEAGVDLVLMTMLIVCFDEHYTEGLT